MQPDFRQNILPAAAAAAAADDDDDDDKDKNKQKNLRLADLNALFERGKS